MITSIILIIIGFILLIKGADLLVSGSSNIAKKYHISELIIGLTIVSIGTSMPELFVSTTSILDNHSDIAIGNVIGSNIVNLLLILGVSAIITSIPFRSETIEFEIPICLITTLIFICMCNTGNVINNYEGLLLILIFVCFILYTIIMAKKNKEKYIEDGTNSNLEKSIFKNIFFIILGIISLKIGGDLAVDNAVIIAKKLGLSQKLIGVTVLAVGTSLPELVTSISAAIRKKTDIAIGNIIGSNIFNILLIMGVSAFIKPINYNISYNYDLILLVISTVLLSIFPYISPKNKMSRMNGIIYVIIYIFYIGNLLLR